MATKQQIFMWKLKNDRAWYMENFLKIRNKQSQLVPFKINHAQKIFNEKIKEDEKKGKPKRYIILKARQLGMSTFTEGYIYHNTSNNAYVNSLIIAHEEKASNNLFQMSKLYYESCPPLIRPMTKYANGRELVFENPTNNAEEKYANPGLRSKITVATAGTQNTGRSSTYHNIHVSEIAFFPNPEDTMLALMQCVPDEPNTFVCLESTANGVGGYFYDMWYAACRGENDFTPLFFPWFDDPNYTTPFRSEDEKEEFIKHVNEMLVDESGKKTHTEEWLLKEQFNLTYEQLNWRKRTIANNCGGDIDRFHQEYPSTPEEAFIASGRPVFNTKALREYEIACVPPVVVGDLFKKDNTVTLVENEKGLLQIWLKPEADMSYVIGADVAEGLVEGDFSVAIVMDENLNICAKWRGHIDPDLYGKILVNLANYYNSAYLAVENNNHGLTTLRSIVDEEYWNVFYTKIYDKLNDILTKKLGWTTSRKSKPIAIDKLAEYIREKFLGIWDFEIIKECYSYVIDDKGKTNAQEGTFDDCVMSLAITLQAFLEGKDQNYLPEISKDDIIRLETRTAFDVPEIIDPLFEATESDVEYSV